MNLKIFEIATALLLTSTLNCFSQQDLKSIYGPDPILHNGRIYNYGKSINLEGHQYLKDTEFLNGSVTINDTTYVNIKLNYDIYNQELLYKYSYEHQTKVISLATEVIDKFTIQNDNFIMLHYNQPVIYEFIGNKSLKILIYSEKEFKLYSSASGSYYKFLKPKKSFYLYDNMTITEFRSKRSFLKLFPKAEWPAIKAYMKRNKVRIKRATDKKLNDLVNFVTQLNIEKKNF